MEKVIWRDIQRFSDNILADGLWELSTRPFERYNHISNSDYGNYVISHDNKPYYIGEAKDICKRLKQQFKPITSTFFKNYQRHLTKNKGLKVLQINNFQVQHMATQLGRKEVEEFGIINLPTLVNSFQLGKRDGHKICCHNGLWHEVQEAKSELLKAGEREIFEQTFQKWFHNTVPSRAGLYLV